MKIVKRLNRQKIKCLFHIRFDLRLIVPNFCDALDIAIMPMNSRIKIGIKIILSILPHQQHLSDYFSIFTLFLTIF